MSTQPGLGMAGLQEDSRKRKRHSIYDRLPIQTPLDNPWLFSASELEESPSRISGISKEVELRIVSRTARFLLEVGRDISVPQLTVSVAIKLFQRFFMLESMVKHSPPQVAAACLFLSCKVQETHKRLKDVIYWTVKTRTRGSPDFPDGMDMFEDSQGYYEEKTAILDKEREVLRVLNFDLTVEHPYQHIWTLNKAFLGTSALQRYVLQAAWNFINDSFRTYVHVRYDPREIATAALFLSARLHHYTLQDGTERDEATGQRIMAWHELFRCNISHIEEICHMLLDMYTFTDRNAKESLGSGAKVREALPKSHPKSLKENVGELSEDEKSEDRKSEPMSLTKLEDKAVEGDADESVPKSPKRRKLEDEPVE